MNFPAFLAEIRTATRRHRVQHGCEAYTFEDGPSLRRLAHEYRPVAILELGTALGYTACCLADGAGLQAHVDTIEADPEHVRLAREQIATHGLGGRITVYEGRFDQVLDTFRTEYDMIFFDGYAPPLLLIQRLRGLLVRDGVLVCSNLQLADAEDALQLANDLADPKRWHSAGSIESGRTLVRIKRRES